MIDWNKYPNFSESEFRCKHTGKVEMNEDFLARLQRLRTRYNKSIDPTSGYRHWSHPVEVAKGHKTGPHTTGRAVDFPVRGHDAYKIIALALEFGFTGIGLRQHGDSRFIHLDDLEHTPTNPRPWIWTYAK